MRSNLKMLREKNGLTVKEIADLLGISESFYYKIESGIRNPTINLARDISNLFGKNINYIFFNEILDDSYEIKNLN